MLTLDLCWLDDEATRLPPTSQTLGPASGAPGLLAAGGNLSLQRLEEAYRHGVFPWYSEGQPVLWWAPDPRMVLVVDEFKVSRSLRKTLTRFIRTPGCEIRIDSAFERVIAACAGAPREGQQGTWILPPMQLAYSAWHRAGAVHSFETWIDGRLAGGLYGVAIGRMFFRESMFSRASDASKIALAALVAFCRAQGPPALAPAAIGDRAEGGRSSWREPDPGPRTGTQRENQGPRESVASVREASGSGATWALHARSSMGQTPPL